jgi:hypothetical protein
VSLPIAELGKLALQERLDAIGATANLKARVWPRALDSLGRGRWD